MFFMEELKKGPVLWEVRCQGGTARAELDPTPLHSAAKITETGASV